MALPGMAFGAAAATEALHRVSVRQRRAAPGEVTGIGGFLGRRLQRNAATLGEFNVDQYVAMLEHKQYRDWFWIGEQAGKWLESSIYASASCGDAALADKARSVLARMLAAQDADGYLGITDPAARTRRHPMRGMDPYELYFTLHALMTVSAHWGSAPALQAARRLGDFFLANVKEGGAEFYPLPKAITIAGHEVHFGLEGALLIDPIMRLYQMTGDARYLDWCRWVVASIDKWSVVETFSNLGKVAAGTMPLHQIQPKVHAHTLNMNMLGFLRLYETTGDAQYLEKVQAAWRAIVANHRYITGGVSLGESYREPHILYNTGQGVETCSSMSWLLLNQHLLDLTGDPAHADVMETLLWNHLPAAQTWDGDGFQYFCPLNGWKPSGYFTGPNCCSSGGPRIMAMLPSFFCGASDNAVIVNQYVASDATLHMKGWSVGLRVSGSYPTGSDVSVEIRHLDSPQTFSVQLRVPGWCSSASMEVNGKRVEGVRAGAYAVLRREWKVGDRVELSFPMETKWVKGSYTNQGLMALTRGPLVYVLETVWTHPEGLGAGAESMPQVVTYYKDGSRPTEADPFAGVATELRAAETPADGLGPVYATDVTLPNGKRIEGRMLPYANLGRWWGTEAEKKAMAPRVGAVRETPAAADFVEGTGYLRGAELRSKSHPFAVWVKPA